MPWPKQYKTSSPMNTKRSHHESTSQPEEHAISDLEIAALHAGDVVYDDEGVVFSTIQPNSTIRNKVASFLENQQQETVNDMSVAAAAAEVLPWAWDPDTINSFPQTRNIVSTNMSSEDDDDDDDDDDDEEEEEEEEEKVNDSKNEDSTNEIEPIEKIDFQKEKIKLDNLMMNDDDDDEEEEEVLCEEEESNATSLPRTKNEIIETPITELPDNLEKSIRTAHELLLKNNNQIEIINALARIKSHEAFEGPIGEILSILPTNPLDLSKNNQNNANLGKNKKKGKGKKKKKNQDEKISQIEDKKSGSNEATDQNGVNSLKKDADVNSVAQIKNNDDDDLSSPPPPPPPALVVVLGYLNSKPLNEGSLLCLHDLDDLEEEEEVVASGESNIEDANKDDDQNVMDMDSTNQINRSTNSKLSSSGKVKKHGILLGTITEVFGPLLQPHYVVHSTNAALALLASSTASQKSIVQGERDDCDTLFQVGTKVSVLTSHAKHVTLSTLLSISQASRCDASNEYDEEVPVNQRDYSDDEEERVMKSKNKEDRKFEGFEQDSKSPSKFKAPREKTGGKRREANQSTTTSSQQGYNYSQSVESRPFPPSAPPPPPPPSSYQWQQQQYPYPPQAAYAPPVHQPSWNNGDSRYHQHHYQQQSYQYQQQDPQSQQHAYQPPQPPFYSQTQYQGPYVPPPAEFVQSNSVPHQVEATPPPSTSFFTLPPAQPYPAPSSSQTHPYAPQSAPPRPQGQPPHSGW